jgi:hypothetical protein
LTDKLVGIFCKLRKGQNLVEQVLEKTTGHKKETNAFEESQVKNGKKNEGFDLLQTAC